jgi:glycosyltransferase involved in cell wall biosynthesis
MASETPARQRPRVSACIITLNEEDRIADCIRSVDWCDEVVVVDSHSDDRTREIAASMGARVIERDWPGHVAQKEFAVRAAQNDWVFCIDADERVSPALREEILRIRDRGFDGAVGWKMPRMSSYLGMWIRHGTWYPDLSLRLFDRRHGRWGGNDPHDRVELDGRLGRLTNHLLHHPYRSFAEHLQTIDRYTTIMAQGMSDRGRKARLSDVVLRPAVRFVRFYFFKAGFLDGWRGLLLAYLAAYYARLKYAKLLVLQRQSKLPELPDGNGRA